MLAGAKAKDFANVGQNQSARIAHIFCSDDLERRKNHTVSEGWVAAIRKLPSSPSPAASKPHESTFSDKFDNAAPSVCLRARQANVLRIQANCCGRNRGAPDRSSTLQIGFG